MVARELETGTFRYAWTQGFGRWRWTLAKLIPLAIAVTAAAAVFSQLFSWYYQPFFADGQYAPLTGIVFDLCGVAFAAWTLAAFTIGAVAGILIRRVVPAIVATLAAYAALALAAGLFLRQHYLAPLVTSKVHLLAAAWIMSQWWTKGATFAFGGRPSMNLLQWYCPASAIGPGKPSSGTIAQCLTQHGYTQWTKYQPANRFWPFQFIEGSWLLALSVISSRSPYGWFGAEPPEPPRTPPKTAHSYRFIGTPRDRPNPAAVRTSAASNRSAAFLTGTRGSIDGPSRTPGRLVGGGPSALDKWSREIGEIVNMRKSGWVIAGVVVALLGLLFTLQGAGVIKGSAMSGSAFWAVAGPVIIIAGLAMTGVGIRGRMR